MSTAELEKTLHQLRSSPPPPANQIPSLLTSAKKSLLRLNCLIPTSHTPPAHLTLARRVLETGACLSIRLEDSDAFTRYVQQLSSFYDLPDSAFDPPGPGEKKKVTGLYLLLLLTKGDYAGFHCVLEGLEGELAGAGGQGATRGAKVVPLEEDRYIGYPVKLERWLMEGSYDRVWKATSLEAQVPSEEFGVFSGVLTSTIRSEIADCSEKAYPSLPIANAKNLLFLDSEGSVVEFAKHRGWTVRDGRIYFPSPSATAGAAGTGNGDAAAAAAAVLERSEKEEMLLSSGQVIENAIGYARELETIV